MTTKPRQVLVFQHIAVEHLARVQQHRTREDRKLTAVGDRIRQLDREVPFADTSRATPRRVHALTLRAG